MVNFVRRVNTETVSSREIKKHVAPEIDPNSRKWRKARKRSERILDSEYTKERDSFVKKAPKLDS